MPATHNPSKRHSCQSSNVSGERNGAGQPQLDFWRISRFLEFCTCVGVRLESDGDPIVIAPHGLADLFHLAVRRNPVEVSDARFLKRRVDKQIEKRWPGVITCVEPPVS
jgi:Nucleotidyltransferase